MGLVDCSVQLPVRAAAARELWRDIDRWETFREGFASVLDRSGEWPSEGATVVWQSTPHGRGRVSERVITMPAHAHRSEVGENWLAGTGGPGADREGFAEAPVQFDDERMSGVRRAWFSPVDDGGVRTTVEIEYRLKGPAWRALALDWLFVRRPLRESLQRELDRFGGELGHPLE